MNVNGQKCASSLQKNKQKKKLSMPWCGTICYKAEQSFISEGLPTVYLTKYEFAAAASFLLTYK